jgi:hypothetical protein
MAQIPIGETITIGLGVNVFTSLMVKRTTPGQVLTVKSLHLQVEDTTVVGSRLVGGVPATVNATVIAGVGSSNAPSLLSPDEVSIDADARFVSSDASSTDAGLMWPARSGRQKFMMTSPPGLSPMVMLPSVYSFFYSATNTWIPSTGLLFDTVARGDSDEAMFGIDPHTVGMFGMTGVWVLHPVPASQPMTVQGFTGGGRPLSVRLDATSRLVLSEAGQERAAITLPYDWFYRPMAISLVVNTADRSASLIVNCCGQAPRSVSTRLLDTASMFAGQVGLMTDPAEASCVMLDLSVWRNAMTIEQLHAAINAYALVYGV